ncbi:MAG: dicarboxylate/amino acid:cation symporter [Parachlamydiales bacterium]|jgi:Na+/H+-dicarboxylate symporter
MQLWVKIIISMVLGVAVGLIFGEQATLLKPIGDIFLSLISMIIVPLVLSSMTVGITSIHDPKKLGRVGLKTMVIYFSTTLIAIGMGLFFGTVLQPGSGLNFTTTASAVLVEDTPTISQIILSIIPSNPVASLVEGNVLQIIVFALFLGVAINFAGEKGKPLREMLDSLADIMYRMTSIIMEFSPIGVFAIMANVAGTFGIAILLPLAKFLGVYYLACLAHVIIVFCGMIWFMAKLSPIPFFRGMRDAISVAFSTCSSAATLPVSMHCVQHNLGVSKNITSFMLPLGTTINMNGTAIFQGMSALFVAQAYGIELDLQSQLMIVVTATLSAIGAAGIPGTGFIMLTVVFSSVGLPIEGLALLAGVDRLREMVSTVLNILGDGVGAVYVAKVEGELDERQYYHEDLVEMEGSTT